jgi:legumain
MFEGLLGNDLDSYVTTAANAIESSWATYCPSFGAGGPAAAADGSSSSSNDASSGSPAAAAAVSHQLPGWRAALLRGMAWLQQQLHRLSGAPDASAAAPAAAADAASVSGVPPQPTPQFTTCLGDLYSVAWMENAEKTNLTAETLLQQYKQVKVGERYGWAGRMCLCWVGSGVEAARALLRSLLHHREPLPPTTPTTTTNHTRNMQHATHSQVRTSNNFTYDQGSHVMQYGDLTVDKELAGDYEGMWHNGSVPPSPTATAAASDAAAAPVVAAAAAAAPGSSELLRHASAAALLQRLGAVAAPTHMQQHHHHHHRAVEQRDADLVPLAAAALHSTCPKRRAAAAAALQAATAARQGLEAAARAAAAALLRQPGSGHLLAASLAGAATSHQRMLREQSQQHSLLLAAGSDARASAVEALMAGPLPGRQAGQPLVDSWDCLRGMVQVRGARAVGQALGCLMA